MEGIYQEFERNGVTAEVDDFDEFVCECRRKAAIVRERSRRPPSRGKMFWYNSIAEARHKLTQREITRTKNCKFCKKNGEPPAVYATHLLKNSDGAITCPILKLYRCPICGATGRRAHTKKYCQFNDWNMTNRDVREPFDDPGEHGQDSQVHIGQYVPVTEITTETGDTHDLWEALMDQFLRTLFSKFDALRQHIRQAIHLK